jgi:glycosyltransferase involved in cell wall biosynthesis
VVTDPHAFYHAANFFVLPSRVEGTPNALLEAMSCGLPVIVSDGAPGPLELVEDGVTGLVVPVNDAAALAAALRRLASDGELRSRLGEAARARVSEYDLPRALAAWESVVGLSC